MDPISLGLGGAGPLIQSFQAVISCMEVICDIRSVDKDTDILNCKLLLEQFHLRTWGALSGIEDGKPSEHLCTEAFQAIALTALGHMVDILTDTETLRSRYGMASEVRNVDTSPKAQKSFNFFSTSQANTTGTTLTASRSLTRSTVPDSMKPEQVLLARSTGKAKKAEAALPHLLYYSWSIFDKKRFEKLIEDLSYFNRSLFTLLISSPAEKLRRDIFYISAVIASTGGANLEAMQMATADSEPELSKTIALKRASESLQPETVNMNARNMVITIDQLELVHKSKRRTLANYKPTHGQAMHVLVEWQPLDYDLYTSSWARTLLRVDTLARMMAKPKPNAFRALECIAYCLADKRVAFVFKLPAWASDRRGSLSLFDIIEGAPQHDSPMYSDYTFKSRSVKQKRTIPSPALETRLALSQAICTSVYHLHLCGIVHKSLRSENILFFRSSADEVLQLDKPYITGLEYNRLDIPNLPAVTRVMGNPEHDRYRHPDYSTAIPGRSARLHDLYSLGLLLLEVAAWTSLEVQVDGRFGDRIQGFLLFGDPVKIENEDTKIIIQPLNDLKYRMGSKYHDVVERCIRTYFEIDEEEEEEYRGHLQKIVFEEVVSEMLKLSV